MLRGPSDHNNVAPFRPSLWLKNYCEQDV